MISRLCPRLPAWFCALDLFRARLGLDAVQSVEGRHERQPEAVLDRMTGQARQPVVRMDRVRGRVHRAGQGVGLDWSSGR